MRYIFNIRTVTVCLYIKKIARTFPFKEYKISCSPTFMTYPQNSEGGLFPFVSGEWSVGFQKGPFQIEKEQNFFRQCT